MNSIFDTVLAPLEWVVAWLMVGFHTILTPIGLPAQACFTWAFPAGSRSTRRRPVVAGGLAGRWFPSSRTCSGCGTVKTKLALPVRTYVAAMCGLVLDQDLNAARILAMLGEAMVAGSGPETVTGVQAREF